MDQQGLHGMDGGKFKRKLSEVNTRAVSRRQNELVRPSGGIFRLRHADRKVAWDWTRVSLKNSVV